MPWWKKIEQPLDETYRVELTYNVTASTLDYMSIGLYAKKGPPGTKNYNIALEFIYLAIDDRGDGRTPILRLEPVGSN